MPDYDDYVERVHADDHGGVVSLLEGLRVKPEPFVYECRIVRPNGEVRVMESRGEPVPGGDRPGKVVGTALDVTDRRRAEDELRLSHALSSSVIDSAPDCVVTIDSKGHVTEFNPAAEATFGYTREQALGAKLAELIIPPQLRGGEHDALRRRGRLRRSHDARPAGGVGRDAGGRHVVPRGARDHAR